MPADSTLAYWWESADAHLQVSGYTKCTRHPRIQIVVGGGRKSAVQGSHHLLRMFIRDVDERQVVLLVATNSRYLSRQIVGICFIK